MVSLNHGKLEKNSRAACMILVFVSAGCSRALLCRVDEQGQLRVQQLTTDHDLQNEAEVERLRRLGVNIEHVLEVKKDF